MKIKIVTDSSSNMRSLPGVEFASVPLKVITEQAEFVDDGSLDVESMVDTLKATKGKSGTSCPNVHDWLEAFGDADRVFAITITSGLSGSYAAAVQAKADYEESHPGAKVCVIDSLSAGPELRLIAERIRDFLASGRIFEEIQQRIAQFQSHTHTLFSLQSLTNLARNGRVSPAVAKIAGVLGIRVVGAASEVGTLQPLHKVRGEKKMLETMFGEMVKRGFRGGRVCISHCFNSEAAQQLKAMILGAFPKSRIDMESCTGLCSFYAERGGLIVGYTDLAEA